MKVGSNNQLQYIAHMKYMPRTQDT